MANSRGRGLARLAFFGVFVAIAGILIAQTHYAIIFGGVGDYSHHIQTVVPSAFEVIPGERVVAGGDTVGEITKAEVTKTGQAHVVMGLKNTAWPLPSDTVLTLRMGGTIKYTDRFVEISKGHADTYFHNGAYVPPSQFVVPVEYNQLFGIFDKTTRQSLQTFFGNAGPSFKAAAQPFRRALPLAPPVLDQATAVFKDLGYDQQALSTLVRSTAQISDAVASSNPGVQTLLQGAANTFGTVGAEAASLRHTLAPASYSLHWLGVSLLHTGTIGPALLVKAAQLARRLNPGVTQLNEMAKPLNDTLREVVNVEPTAVDTLQTVQQSAPNINSVLSKARTELFPQLTSIGNQGATELACVRPYTPDAMNILDEFAGFNNGFNNPHTHFLHTLVSVLPFPDAMPLNTQQMHSILPNLRVTNPQPPGMGWNQPWYQPQCGSSPSIDTNAGDSENNTFDPFGSKAIFYGSTTPSYSPAPTPFHTNYPH